MKTWQQLLVFVLPLLLLGCASHSHKSPVLLSIVNANGTNFVVAYEEESDRAFFAKGSVSKARSKITRSAGGAYSRTFSVDDLQGAGDPETLAAFFNGLGTVAGVAAGTAARSAAGLPTLPVPATSIPLVLPPTPTNPIH